MDVQVQPCPPLSLAPAHLLYLWSLWSSGRGIFVLLGLLYPINRSLLPSMCVAAQEAPAFSGGTGSACSMQTHGPHTADTVRRSSSMEWEALSAVVPGGCLPGHLIPLGLFHIWRTADCKYYLATKSARVSWGRRNRMVVINHAEMMHCGLKMEKEGTD